MLLCTLFPANALTWRPAVGHSRNQVHFCISFEILHREANALKCGVVAEVEVQELGEVVLNQGGPPYNLTTCIVVTPNESGATIQGYSDANHSTRKAVINRGNTGADSYVFDLAGVD
ncbi:hypothetical protein BH11PLA2_BH11PLA2_23410 [soil metagenome]